jgi:outer membrane murein-binding lipoprotein Lpp
MPELREVESLSVQLTRMEGKLDGVDYKVSDLLIRVTDLEARVRVLESDTQALGASAQARDEKAVALALALKEAEQTRRDQEKYVWTPFNKFMAIVSTLASVGLTVYYFTHP